jgi:hypothetical protein
LWLHDRDPWPRLRGRRSADKTYEIFNWTRLRAAPTRINSFRHHGGKVRLAKFISIRVEPTLGQDVAAAPARSASQCTLGAYVCSEAAVRWRHGSVGGLGGGVGGGDGGALINQSAPRNKAQLPRRGRAAPRNQLHGWRRPRSHPRRAPDRKLNGTCAATRNDARASDLSPPEKATVRVSLRTYASTEPRTAVVCPLGLCFSRWAFPAAAATGLWKLPSARACLLVSRAMFGWPRGGGGQV